MYVPGTLKDASFTAKSYIKRKTKVHRALYREAESSE